LITAVILVLLASSSDPALLAPGPEELDAAFTRTEWLLQRSAAIERALARLHNRWAEANANGPPKNPCEDADAKSIAARARALGGALRDSVQSARAQKKRLERVYVSPTVAAIIDAKAKRRHDRLIEQVAHAQTRYAELRAWHHNEVERAVKRCKNAVSLTPTAGIASSVPCAGDECTGPVAIIGVGGGRICPANVLADGTVVVVVEGQACYGDETCSCVPTPVLPGAVLGP
jgi:hypothetical protein